MRLAIIPARGGSKRIPQKNIKEFAGQPIIAWSIQAAKESHCFDRIIVSTDDPEIARIARLNGADVPFMRKAELSGDDVPTVPVVADAVAWHIAHGDAVTEACCIYATAPFVQPDDLIKGLEILLGCNASYAFSVTEYAHPIQRALKIKSYGRLSIINEDYATCRTQDLDIAVHDAAQFYWGKAHSWLDNRNPLNSNAAPVFIPRHRSRDIDSEDDWREAEILFCLLRARSCSID